MIPPATPPFPALFSPIQIGAYTLANRIMNTGHAAHFQTGDGIPTDDYVAYLRERARGGAGIIVTGHTVPHYDGEHSLSFASFDERIVAAYRRLSGATHEFDVPLLAQLGHRGRRVSDAAAFLGRPVRAPSPVPPPDFSTPMLVPHELTTSEVETIVAEFRGAAQRAMRGNLDGIELSVGMDYLFTNFLNQLANRRVDRYGGATLAERMTFLNEVVTTVRAEIGTGRILGIRFYDDLEDYSLRLDDYKQVAQLLETAGQVDYFNMWQGLVPSPRSGRSHWPPHYAQPGQFAYLPAGLKEAVGLPVVGAGRIDSPALANRLVADGKADLIGMARTLIADPHFPNKAKAGRTAEIRTCIACTQSCVGHIYLGMGVGCIYNPVTGREATWSDLPATATATATVAASGQRGPRKLKVVVVGGGPAGLEAARTSAERGHEVTVLERAGRLGGQVNLLSRAPDRENFDEIVSYFERQLGRLQVDVRLNTTATRDYILSLGPDAVVVATGSNAFRPEIIGCDRANVLTARQVLAGTDGVGERVVVIDATGRAEGPTTADYLATAGRAVEIITGLPYVGTEMPGPAWHHLLEQLMTKGVKLTPFTAPWEITDDGLDTYNVVTWEPGTITGVDTIVLACGGIADDELYGALQGQVDTLYNIGDSYQARDIEVAVVDGHRVGRAI